MTDTEEAMQAHLDQHPDDHHTRMVLADHLEEIGDPRAKGYRALGLMRKIPTAYSDRGEPEEHHNLYSEGPFIPHRWRYWLYDDTDIPQPDELPGDWFARMHHGPDVGPPLAANSRVHSSRRSLDDEAAHEFGNLPEHRRKKLLDAAMKMGRSDTAMRYMKSRRVVLTTAQKRCGLPHSTKSNTVLGLKQYSKPKISPNKKKKPVTTWLSPIEIRKLRSMGHNAQDGIRKLVHKLVIGKLGGIPNSDDDSKVDHSKVGHSKIDHSKTNKSNDRLSNSNLIRRSRCRPIVLPAPHSTYC